MTNEPSDVAILFLPLFSLVSPLTPLSLFSLLQKLLGATASACILSCSTPLVLGDSVLS